jgi:flagellar FliL protein
MAATDNPGAEIGLLAGEKKRPNILLIIVGLLVFLLVVAVGGFIGYTRLPGVVAGITGNGAVVEQRVRRLEVKDMIVLEPFVVNLADIDDVLFLRATFQLGMAEKMKEELDKNSMGMATIRDSIISLLCAKTSNQIMTAEGKEALREEIRVLINERYPQNRVAEVFIGEFLVQY